MIVGIGLSKTGTTSLYNAFKYLGYRSKHHFINPNNVFNELDNYDFVVDTPIPILFEEIDKLYKNSKFILTIRNIDDWHKSIETHFNIRHPFNKRPDLIPGRLALYGMKEYKKPYFDRFYRGHIDYVKDYFKYRKNDLLIMNICNGDGWEKLCPFIKKEIPEITFPYNNKT